MLALGVPPLLLAALRYVAEVPLVNEMEPVRLVRVTTVVVLILVARTVETPRIANA